MKWTMLLTGLLCAATASSCTDRDAPSPGTGEAETDQRLVVELFEPGIVSSPLPEFATTFTPSGDTVFFNRTPPDRSRIDLLYAVRSESGWGDPEEFEPLRGVRAIDPFVSADGRTLYFSSDLPRPGGADGSFNLWRLEIRGSGGEPGPLPAPINTDSSEVFNSFSDAGEMVFSSRRDGDRFVYFVPSLTEDGREPERLELGDGSPASNPALHPSGHYLIFARSVGEEPSDLYVACREGSAWSAPVRLPEPVNSPFTDFAPGFGGDHLYFTSERPGVVGAADEGERPPGDIYRVAFARIGALCASSSPAA